MIEKIRDVMSREIPLPAFNAGFWVLAAVAGTVDAAGWVMVDRVAIVRAIAVVVAALIAWRARGYVDEFRSWRAQR
jgi:hypothetical protein